MPQLPADGHAGLLIRLLLRRGQVLLAGPAGMRRGPAGEFQVALLGIGMAQAVHFRQAGIGGVALVDSELLDVAAPPGDQGAQSGQPLGLLQQDALLPGADGDGAFPPTLGPAGLKLEMVTSIRPAGPDLEGFLPPEPEGPLQPQAHPDMLILDLVKLLACQTPGLAVVRHELPVRYAIEIIGTGDHGPPVNLLRPPA